MRLHQLLEMSAIDQITVREQLIDTESDKKFSCWKSASQMTLNQEE